MENIKEGTILGNYTVVKATGRGAFSQVYLATHNSTGLKVALKVVLAKSLEETMQKVMVENELNIFKSIDFPLICEYYESFYDKEYFIVVLEFVENGSLLSYINKFGKLSEDEARHYFVQLLITLEYLHSKCKVAHRDLKAENVLIDRNHNIRLIDFGFSHNMTMKKPVISGPCGSPAYAPPEVLKNMPFSQLSDVWSSGVFLYAITTGHLPFIDENIQRLMQKILYTEPKYNLNISPELADLIMKMLKKNLGQRISFHEIWSHPWIMRYPGIKEVSKLTRYTRLPLSSSILSSLGVSGSQAHTLEEKVKNAESDPMAVEYRLLKRNDTTDEIESYSRWLKKDTLHTNTAGDMPPDELDSGVATQMQKVSAPSTPTKQTAGNQGFSRQQNSSQQTMSTEKQGLSREQQLQQHKMKYMHSHENRTHSVPVQDKSSTVHQNSLQIQPPNYQKQNEEQAGKKQTTVAVGPQQPYSPVRNENTFSRTGQRPPSYPHQISHLPFGKPPPKTYVSTTGTPLGSQKRSASDAMFGKEIRKVDSLDSIRKEANPPPDSLSSTSPITREEQLRQLMERRRGLKGNRVRSTNLF